MTGVRIPLHGRTHLPGGSDPIPFAEISPTFAYLQRDGSPGTFAVTSHAVNQTTTAVQHNLSYSQGDITVDTVSTPSRITINETGLYIINVSLNWVANTATPYAITSGYGINSTSAVFGTFPSMTINVSDTTLLEFSLLRNMTEGNYITQLVGQNSGSTVTLAHLCLLRVARLIGPFSTASLGDDIDGGSP